MAIDFSKYVFKGRPLQDFDIGQGFRDVIEARFGREKIDNQKQQFGQQLQEQQAGRADTNTRWASQVAEGRADQQYKAQSVRQEELNTLKQKARGLIASGHLAEGRALFGRIAELGGSIDERASSDPTRPIFEIKGGDQGIPKRETDTQNVRSEIFGGPRQAAFSQSFQAPSPFHAGGQPGPVKNPFDVGVPTSAERLPPPAAAAPPQPPAAPAAPPAPGRPGEAAAAASADAQQAIGGLEASANGTAPGAPPADDGGFQARLQAAIQRPEVGAVLQSHGIPTTPGEPKNPFNPYQLDTNQIGKENNARMDPYFQGIQGAVPPRYAGRVKSFHEGSKKLGYGPEETLKLMQPTFGSLVSLMKGEMSAEASANRMEMTGQNMGFSQSQRLRDFAARQVGRVQKQFDTENQYKRYEQIDGVNALLDEGAAGNGNSDVLAISTLRNLYQDGIMTDKDFAQVSRGIQTLWQDIKAGATEKLLANGLNPDTRANLRRVVEIANRRSQQALVGAQNQMLTRVLNDRTIAEEERQEYINATAEMIPMKLWSPKLRELMGEPVDQKTGPIDQSGNYQVAPSKGASAPAGDRASVSVSSSSSKRGPKNEDEELDELTK